MPDWYSFSGLLVGLLVGLVTGWLSYWVVSCLGWFAIELFWLAS